MSKPGYRSHPSLANSEQARPESPGEGQAMSWAANSKCRIVRSTAHFLFAVEQTPCVTLLSLRCSIDACSHLDYQPAEKHRAADCQQQLPKVFPRVTMAVENMMLLFACFTCSHIFF
jgi:hypothetical protein